MRIVFMGTPQFAVPALSALAGHGHEIVAVYTRAPQPAGRRGLTLTPSPVQTLANNSRIRFSRRRRCAMTNKWRFFARMGRMLAVVVAYGLILPKSSCGARARLP